MSAKATQPRKRLGTWNANDDGQIGGGGAPLAIDTIYQAATDGFVVITELKIWIAGDFLRVKTDPNTPPTIDRTGMSGTDTGGAEKPQGIVCPVKKNDYWVPEASIAATVYWIPLEP